MSKIIIVTTLYNAEQYISKCILSMKDQNYKDFTCYITDDISTDNSIEVLTKTIGIDKRFILYKNKAKAYQPGNYDYIIRNNKNIDDYDIVVELDGDDWFPDSNVLDRIKKVYEDKNIWIANGSFVYSDGRPGFAQAQTNFNNLRSSVFSASHIRTWRAGLWRKIIQRDLRDSDNIPWKVAGDLAFMYPMLEMAGEKRYKFMSDINYVYNEETPLNDHKVNMPLVNHICKTIRSMPAYNLIDTI